MGKLAGRKRVKTERLFKNEKKGFLGLKSDGIQKLMFYRWKHG